MLSRCLTSAFFVGVLSLFPALAPAKVLEQWPRGVDFTELGEAIPYTDERGYGFELGTSHQSVAGVGDPGSAAAFFYSVKLPEGNYRVSVTFGGDGASDTTVKAESRRLMLESIKTIPGETVTRSFLVNVRTTAIPPPEINAPGGSAVVLNDREIGSFTWDDKVTLEFNGRWPEVQHFSIVPVTIPTVYLVGDSTVTDQRWEDGASWGQMLPRFLPGVAIANHAESGETMKSFISGLRLAKILSQVQPGDYVFIQFGHNDQKKQWPQTYVEAATTYRDYLRVFIAEARLRGATPVLVTSMQRRTFDEHGRITNTHGDYPQAVREVAVEQAVALIDLERLSTTFYEALGPDRAPLAFANHGKDATHHNNHGAYELAKCVAQAIRAASLPLADALADDFTGFDPAQPDDPAEFSLPASPLHSDVHPRGN